ncbi:MAG TPA: pitrilysin family protein [Acidobacteriaceae bacterium]
MWSKPPIFLLLIAVLSVSSPTLSQSTKLQIPDIKYETYKLPNGLQVILHRDTRLPLVGVDIWYHVGPRNERAGRTGFAHLFEHMMFQGSQHVGEKSHIKNLESAGATGINGTTSFDRTNYFETVPSNQIETALWLESDRMGFLLDTLNRAKLTNQQDVVRNERRQSLENRPYGLVDEAMFHELFPADHPYHARVIGSHADIEAARLEDVRQFFMQYYSPNNATLSIAGDIDIAGTKGLIDKYFGPIPQGPPVPKVDATTPAITAEKKVTVTDTIHLPKVDVAWLAPPAFQPGDADADLATFILGGGNSSRMYRRLVYEQQIAQSVECGNFSLALRSIVSCEFIARPGVTPDQLLTAADAVLDGFTQTGPTAVEVESARTKHITDTITGLQRLGGFGGVADQLNYYNQYTGDPGYLPKDIARYQAVTQESVRSFSQTYLGHDKRVIIYGVPGTKVVDDVPRSPADTDAGAKIEPQYSADFEKAQSWRNTPPKPGPQPALTLPQPVVFALHNGLKVYLVETHQLPVITASFLTLSGGEANSPQKPGVAGFTAAMLTQGTTSRSSEAIAADSDRLGATLTATAGQDNAAVTASALSNVATPVVDLLSDVTLHPVFDSKEVDRLRKSRLTTLVQMRDQPLQIATQIADRALFGAESPYGYPEIGTEESLKSISHEDLAGFWKTHSFPGDSALVFTGDLTQSEARRLAEKYFGSWSATGIGSEPPSPPTPPARKVILVDRPGAPQTAIFAAGLGVPRSSPDRAKIEVVNAMLGGLFSSRINMNLREEHGYTYGARSLFRYRRGSGPFLAYASVRTDVTAPAIEELFKELDGIRTRPLTASELEMSKDAIVRALPGDFETAEQTAGQVSSLFTYNLPLDYLRAYPGKVEAVTLDDTAAITARYFHPENMVLIAVGDKSKIQPAIEKLNLGPIEEWTTAGEPVKK